MDIVNFSKISEVLKYLKDNLSTTRTSKIDNLDASISSIAPTKFYTPSLAYISRTNTNTGNWVTLKEVTGKGIVSETLLYLRVPVQNAGSIFYCGYRITVDNNIVMSGRFGGSAEVDQSYTMYLRNERFYLSGFSLREYLIRANYYLKAFPTTSGAPYKSNYIFSLINQNDFSVHSINSIKNYPSIENTSSAVPGVCLLYNPLKFSTNFKVEILDQTTFNANLQCSLWLE